MSLKPVIGLPACRKDIDGQPYHAVGEKYLTALVESFTVDDVPGFAVAVQWHPEWQVTRNDFSMAIFGAFGDACREYAGQRND